MLMKHTNINLPEGYSERLDTMSKYAKETDEQRAARTGLSSIELTDQQSKAVQKTPYRVSLESIVAKIAHKDFMTPERHPHMTLCVLTLVNGFIFIGKSTPADPHNFNRELGEKFAYEDAVRQVWPMEAYLLREKMSEEE
jgi:hypothetical protein